MAMESHSDGNLPRKEGRKYITTDESISPEIIEKIATALSWAVVVIFFPISICCCFLVVRDFERAIIFRLGHFRQRARGPGLVWILPCIDDEKVLDLRTRVEVIPKQDVITKDSVTIRVDGVLFYCIENPMHAFIQIANVHESTLFIAQTTLRNMVGSMTLHDLLVSRTTLSTRIAVAVEHATEKWGVRIIRVEIKDISLPESLERSLASEAEALREARAKIILAEGDLNASHALKEASKAMTQNHVTLQLRHLQNLIYIAKEHHLKIYFPFPMEMMTPFENNAKINPDIYSSFINPYLDGLSTLPSFIEGLFEGNEENIVVPADPMDSSREDAKENKSNFSDDGILNGTQSQMAGPLVSTPSHFSDDGNSKGTQTKNRNKKK